MKNTNIKDQILLECINLNRTFNGIQVLKDINLSFSSSEHVCIIGRSGSGKSTLANILCGFDQSYTGQLKYRGVDLKTGDNSVFQKEVQMVSQNFSDTFNPAMTIYDILFEACNVKYGKTLSDIQKIAIIHFTISSFNLPLYTLFKVAANLSGGEKQRVAIARISILSPQITLFDESLGALDVFNAISISKQIKKAIKGTSIIISHDLDICKIFCTRLIVLYNGEIVEDMAGEELQNAFSVTSEVDFKHEYTRKLFSLIPKLR